MATRLEQTVVVVFQDLTILPELENCNFPRTDEELAPLVDQIRTEGVIRDPIVIWPHEGQLILVDGFGRRRVDIILQLGKPVMAHQMVFESMEEAKDWIQVNQLGRRNLTDDQTAYTSGSLYLRLKFNQDAMVRYLKLTGRLDLLSNGEEDSEIHTARILGKIFRTNEKTIRRNADFARGVDLIREKNPTLAQQILHQTVIEDGNPVRVRRALIVKFSELNWQGEVNDLFDVQEAVDMSSEKGFDKDNQEKGKILIIVKKFLNKPSLPLKEETFEKMNEYYEQHCGKGKQVRKLVA